MSSVGNRKHLLPFYDADNIEDAWLLAPDWTEAIVETDDGWMCFESEPAADVWAGRT